MIAEGVCAYVSVCVSFCVCVTEHVGTDIDGLIKRLHASLSLVIPNACSLVSLISCIGSLWKLFILKPQRLMGEEILHGSGIDLIFRCLSVWLMDPFVNFSPVRRPTMSLKRRFIQAHIERPWEGSNCWSWVMWRGNLALRDGFLSCPLSLFFSSFSSEI